MKKVLIITYYWPPTSGSGVQRWLKFAKYLPEFGIQPIIFTPENPEYPLRDKALEKDIPSDTRVIKRPIKEAYGLLSLRANKNKTQVQTAQNGGLISKLKSWIRGNLFIPDPKVSWVKPSVQYLDKLLRDEEISSIITTGPPHSMHLIGLELKQNHKVQWIADFRDPWSQFGDLLDKYYVSTRNRKKYEQLEQSVLQTCDLVLMTSKHMHERLMPFDHKKMRVITNGYDKSDFSSYTDITDHKQLMIYHAGMLYEERAAPSFWKALDVLCDSYPRLNLQLVGVDSGNVTKEIKAHGHLSQRFTFEQFKPHSEVIVDYGKANILLLLVNNSDNARACIPGKTFEYLATGKPIICIAPEGAEVADALLEGNNLIIAYTNTVEQNVKLLEEFFESLKYEETTALNTEKYSRRNLTQELVKLIS